MTNPTALETRQNKNFVLQYGTILKDYAQKNYTIHGQGIVVVNLLLLTDESINELNANDSDCKTDQEFTVDRPISYIPKTSFWFKMISLKIKKKHQINIQQNDNFNDKFLIVFIKDASIEHFSIYSVKV